MAPARPTTIPAGTTLPQVPRQSASLWNRYDFDPRWGVGLGAIYRDEMFTSTSNAVRVKSFIRYDAAVFFRASDALQLQLNVENLFDKHYMASANSDTNISPGAPRSLYLTANFSF